MSSPRQSGEVRPDVIAAGAVVVRKGADGHEVLLVHRPRYDDWSFPKGKRDRGEHVATCAVREVLEETGSTVALGVPLGDQRYRVAADRWKTVHYWVAREVAGSGAEFAPNDEVDELRWLPWDEARALLTYPHDRTTLDEAWPVRRRTRTVVVLRHAKALDRGEWRRLTQEGGEQGDDRRPLAELGRDQAALLLAPLAAWAPGAVVSSPSARCAATVAPLAAATGIAAVLDPRLSEEDATGAAVGDLVAQVVGDADVRSTVVCSHRPVLPWVFEALGVAPVSLPPAAWAVVHLRRGAPVATEVHRPD